QFFQSTGTGNSTSSRIRVNVFYRYNKVNTKGMKLRQTSSCFCKSVERKKIGFQEAFFNVTVSEYICTVMTGHQFPEAGFQLGVLLNEYLKIAGCRFTHKMVHCTGSLNR